uniref:Uncharacterized protein n=1 Tax=Arundo donax TaxID=35708 RepID=A0A0A9BU69_ARUDO
MHQAQIGGH